MKTREEFLQEAQSIVLSLETDKSRQNIIMSMLGEMVSEPPRMSDLKLPVTLLVIQKQLIELFDGAK